MSDAEAGGGEGGGGGGGGGGGSKKLIIIIVAVVLLIAIGGGVAFFLLMGGEKKEGEEGHEEGKKGAEHAEVHDGAEPLAAPTFVPVGTYIVNLKDGRKYLKTTIQLMLSEAAAGAYVTNRLVEIKDLILQELQEYTAEDLRKPGAKEELRAKLTSKIMGIFPKKPDWEDPEPIKKVLFEEFFLQ